MLLEMLVVSIFVMGIFALLYTNVLPLIAEYEKVENYNTVESTYKAHWARKMILDGLNLTSYKEAYDKGFVNVTDCSLYNVSSLDDMQSWCNNYKKTNNITAIYLTTYSLEKFKTTVKNSDTFSREFKEYISYLPVYSKNLTKAGDEKYFHVIVEFFKSSKYNYGISEVYSSEFTK